MREITIRRLDFGYFVRPGEETLTGTPRVEPCLGYLVGHPGGLLLFDTGLGSHPEVDAHYRIRRRPVAEALAAAGVDTGDVTHVVNCHLHFDHCGGNPALAGRPVFVQRVELASARTVEHYTLPELLDDAAYVELDGDAEVLSSVLILPTPGHTDGHQSLVVRRPDGTVIVAGQSHDNATAYAADALAWRAREEHHAEVATPEWIDRLARLDPARVVFAHDHSVWEP